VTAATASTATATAMTTVAAAVGKRNTGAN
jgi:hypothetical protein